MRSAVRTQKISKGFARTMITPVLVLLLSHLPQVAVAETTAVLTMIPTSSLVADLTEEQARSNVESFIARTDIQQQLLDRGLTQEEVSLRLAALSKAEMNMLSQQVEEARAGGDVLFTVLIVVLIIYLVRRI